MISYAVIALAMGPVAISAPIPSAINVYSSDHGRFNNYQSNTVPYDNPQYEYRTPWSIIVSCLVSISACVWVAIHRNIPGPNQTWISIHLDWVKIIVLALLVPEWVLAWAVRQFINARCIAAELEEAREEVQRNWEKQRASRRPTIIGRDRRANGTGGGGIHNRAADICKFPYLYNFT